MRQCFTRDYFGGRAVTEEQREREREREPENVVVKDRMLDDKVRKSRSTWRITVMWHDFFGGIDKAESFEFRAKTRYLVLDLTGLVRSTLDCVFLMWTMPMIYRCVHYLQELLKHPGQTVHSHPGFLPHLSRRCSIDGSPYCGVFFFGGGGRLPILVPQKHHFKAPSLLAVSQHLQRRKRGRR